MPQTAVPSDEVIPDLPPLPLSARTKSHQILKEDHAIKRKNKSLSKRRRRRGSSDSSSSDDFRPRRKSSRRNAKRSRRSSSHGGDYKKRKSSKKSSKKKSRKSRRYTSSDSSRSCSTCRGRSSSPGDSLSVRSRSRSRSPVRKSKLRVRGRSSGRDRSRRSRYRSPSCSTCSAGSRSRSPRKDASLERKDVSRHTRTKLSDDERIAITGRRQEKKGRSELSDDERIAITGRRQEKKRRSELSDDERIAITGRRQEKKGRSELSDDERIAITGRRQEKKGRSELSDDERKAITGRRQEKKGRSELSDDERIAITRRRREKKGRSDDAADARKDPGEDEPYKKRRSASSKANGGSRLLAEDLSAIKNSEAVANRMPAGDSNGNDHLGLESGSSRGRSASTNTGVVAGTGISETEDLEMILRRKALENFRKFRCGIPASSTSVGDAKVEAINSESQRPVELKLTTSLDKHRHPPSGGHPIKVVDTSTSKSHNNVTSKLAGELKINSFSNTENIQCQVKNVHESSDKIVSVSDQMSLPKGFLKPKENKSTSSLDSDRHTHGRDQPLTVGVNSLSVLVGSGSDGKTATKLAGDHNISSSSNNRSNDDLGMSKHKSYSQMSSEQSSLTKDVEGERAVIEPKSGSTPRPDGNIAYMSASGSLCPNTENENCKSGEPGDATVSGGQFEQKTFSRTRDGEVVQVSYKVYIPQKSTTLARRRLQR